jgi:hypothetical protein
MGTQVLTEGINLGDVIKWEVEPRYCRDEVILLAGAGAARTVTVGMALGKVTASAKFVQLDPSAHDGSEVCAGIVTSTTATAADGVDGKVIAVRRGPAVASMHKTTGVQFVDGISDPERATAFADLLALGVVGREGV